MHVHLNTAASLPFLQKVYLRYIDHSAGWSEVDLHKLVGQQWSHLQCIEAVDLEQCAQEHLQVGQGCNISAQRRHQATTTGKLLTRHAGTDIGGHPVHDGTGGR